MTLAPTDAVTAPALGADAEAQLWRRFRVDGDAAARELLVEFYRPHARTVAATYFGRRIDDDIEFDEYHQWALVGMIESVDRFDPRHGTQFKTFSSRRMHGCILDGLECATEKQQQIAVRRRLRQERAAEALAGAQADRRGAEAQTRGDDADLFALLAEVGIGLAVGLMLEGTGMVIAERGATTPDGAYDGVELRQLRAALGACIDDLSEQEQRVVKAHYQEDLRFVEIAGKLGVTKGRVSQVHRQALVKLRQMLGASAGLDIAL